MEYKIWLVTSKKKRKNLKGNLERCEFLSGQTEFFSVCYDETAFVSFETHIGVTLKYSSGDTAKELAYLFFSVRQSRVNSFTYFLLKCFRHFMLTKIKIW